MKNQETEILKRKPANLAKTVEKLLPEIRSLIEEARHRAVTAANLSMVTLYWNIGRVISTQLQTAPGRAGYGKPSWPAWATGSDGIRARFLPAEPAGYAAVHEIFQIRQPLASKSVWSEIRQPVAGKSMPRNGHSR